jgi:hypothetical protein
MLLLLELVELQAVQVEIQLLIQIQLLLPGVAEVD